MGTFASYNTDDPKAPAGSYPALGGGGIATIGPVQTGVASKIAGSVFSDVAGSCSVQQCFDFWLPGGDLNPTPHFDIADVIAVSAGVGAKIDLDVIAPVLQVVYTNGGTPQVHFRLFVRVFGVNRG